MQIIPFSNSRNYPHFNSTGVLVMRNTSFTITATYLFLTYFCTECRTPAIYHYTAFQCSRNDSNKSIKFSEFQKLSLLSTYLTERTLILHRMY